jgi:hypothetical protein
VNGRRFQAAAVPLRRADVAHEVVDLLLQHRRPIEQALGVD